MPNLLLTSRCARKCPYCFAGRSMSETGGDEAISWENLIYVADLLQAEGHRRIQLLGGEPTIHPDFNDMAVYLLDRGFELNVFTSGLMPEGALNEAVGLFSHLPREVFSFLVNLNDPHLTPGTPGERKKVERFLAAFGERCSPGFNIYRTDFSLDFILQDINRFGMARTIRLGLAHPILGFDNAYVSLGDIDRVISRLFEHRERFEVFQVWPGLDCGFPMCRFTDAQMAWLARNCGQGPANFGCGPVVDIGPDLSVWPCFPLSGFKRRSLLEFDGIKQVHDHYLLHHEKARVEAGGLYPECDMCRFREQGRCSGGCVAHLLKAFADEARLRLPEVYA